MSLLPKNIFLRFPSVEEVGVHILDDLVEHSFRENLRYIGHCILSGIFFLAMQRLVAEAIREETLVQDCITIDLRIVIRNQHRLLRHLANLQHVEDLQLFCLQDELHDRNPGSHGLAILELRDVVTDHLLTALRPLYEHLVVFALVGLWVVRSVDRKQDEGEVDEN